NASSPLEDTHLPISGSAASAAVSLVSLTHHVGVSVLAPEQTVSFGRGLTVVFGECGFRKFWPRLSGNSGHGRLRIWIPFHRLVKVDVERAHRRASTRSSRPRSRT